MTATKPRGADAKVVLEGAAEDGVATKPAARGDIDDSSTGAKQQAGRPLQAKGIAVAGRSHAEVPEKMAPDMGLRIAQVSGQLADGAGLSGGIVQPEFCSANLGGYSVVEHHRIIDSVFLDTCHPLVLFSSFFWQAESLGT